MKIKENLKKLLCKFAGISYEEYLLNEGVVKQVTEKKIVLKDYEFKDYHLIRIQLTKLENSLDEGLTDDQKKDLYINIVGRLKLLVWQI